MNTLNAPKKTPAASGNDAVGLAALRHSAAAWWSLRTQREKRLLEGCLLLLSVVVLWLVAVRPALLTLEAARSSLPVLRVQVAQVGAMALEAQVLSHSAVARHDRSLIGPALDDSLSRSGLGLQVSRSVDSREPATRWKLNIDNAAAGPLLQWLASLPGLMQVQVNSAQLTRAKVNGRDRPGYVTGTIVLGVADGSGS